MKEEESERKGMSEKERKEMEEQEKTAEVWTTEKKERMERASGDIAEKTNIIVNPTTAGGKILNGTQGETAAGARCGYPSKPCDR
ncbi:MAG: hypothetical protein ABFC34_03200 [Methanobacterium sp.]